MKITFVVSGSIRSNFTYRALALAKVLHMLGHEVSMIAPKADKYNDFVPEVIHSIQGVKILHPFQFTTRRVEINFLPYIFSTTRMVLREKPDLVYVYKPTPISIVGFVAKLFHKTPVIIDVDDLGSEVMRIEGHPWYQRELTAWSERFAAKHADRIVVASTYLSRKYQNEFPEKPIHIMPNGVEADWFIPAMASQDKKRLVFMGAINRKNILDPFFDVLPDVLKESPETKVLIMGDGRFLSYFKKRAATSGIEGSITFTGWLELDEARTHLNSGDIGYCYMPDSPTNRAANNMKVSQYMARGVVPLVSDVGDLASTVAFGAAGYVCKADDIQELGMALLRALKDPDGNRKADTAKIVASEKFNWSNLGASFNAWLIPAKDRQRKKMYIVATGVPGDVGGAEIRIYNLIKQSVRRDDMDIDVFCISPKDSRVVREEFESKIKARCHVARSHDPSLAASFKAVFLERVPPAFQEFKSSGLGEMFFTECQNSIPDVVQIEQLHAYYCIRPYIPWLKRKGVQIIFDCHNVEFQALGDSLKLFSTPKKLVGKFIVPHLKNMEIEAAKQSDAIFACSTIDANFFGLYNHNVHVIPNGVDYADYHSIQKIPSSTLTLIFMGGVGYPPNSDALEFYLKEIHPRIKSRIPEVQLLAIGATEPWLERLGLRDQSVKALGFVDDVRPYLGQADIGICPVRFGSGTRIKILTYMAAGLPVVSTTKGAEGVAYANGKDIMLADEPEAFAEAIVELSEDLAYRGEIAHSGQHFVSENYDWNMIGKKLAHIYNHDLR